MKKFISLLMSIILCIIFVSCSSEDNHDGEAKIPSSSSAMSGENYEDVIKIFEDAGFTNVKIEKIEDLITGWLTKDGEVEEVSVGGNVDYSEDKWVLADTEVIIKYHTFADEIEKSEQVEESETNEENAITDMQYDNILNVDNCEELKAILNTKNEFDPIIKEFADKYYGKIIEFDGNTAYVSAHKDYNTRFNYLIYSVITMRHQHKDQVSNFKM